MKTLIKRENELTGKEWRLISYYRQKEFGKKEEKRGEGGVWWVLVYEDERLRSLGRLEESKVLFGGKDRPVLLMSAIVATEKGKGYGKLVLEGMKRFVEEGEISAVGFCETKLLPFYRKSGIDVLGLEDNQFVYVDDKGQVVPKLVPGEVFYFAGKDGLMERILGSEDKTVGVYRSEI